MKTLYLIDGHAQFFRAFHAIRTPMTSPVTKEPTNATFGFIGMILKLLRELKPDYVAVAIDVSHDRGTFRSQLYPDYKATRAEPPETLGPQIERCISILKAIGIPVIGVEGFEADDVIATIADQVAKDGERLEHEPAEPLKLRIVSKDKDLAQLLADGKVEMYDIHTAELLDVARLKADKGITPEQVIDTLALSGDTVDNVPGVPGIGPKTAAELIAEWGTLDNLLANADKIKGKRGENIRNTAPLLPLSKQLVTLRKDAPVTLNLRDAEVKNFPLARLEPILVELGFNRYQTELKTLLGAPTDAPLAQTSAPAPRRSSKPDPMTGGLFDAFSSIPAADAPSHVEGGARATGNYRCISTRADLDNLLRELAAATIIAFDTETTSLSPRDARLCGISLSVTSGGGCYIPVRSPDPSLHLDEATVLSALRPILEDPARPKCGHNLKYDLMVLRGAGVEVRGIAFDSMIASYLIDSSRSSHSLDNLALALLNRRNISITELIGSGKDQRTFDTVPIDRATDYAAEDADVSLQLHDIMAPQLRAMGLQSLFDDVEMPLVSVLAELEWNGITVDPAELDHQAARLSTRIESLREQINAAAPRPFSPDSPKQLSTILFNKPTDLEPGLGLKPVKKTKTGLSTDVEVLEKLAADPEVTTPVPALIVEYRQLTKLVSTYLVALKEAINPATGRVHASFNQTVAATGRLSSSDPNLQNIPIRTEVGREIRKAFIPAKGCLLIGADYSQIELRMLAHLSKDPALIDAFKSGADIHREVAAQIHSTTPDKVTREQRDGAKMVNFGIVYGITAYGLARRLGIDNEQAAEIIDAYKRRFAGITTFLEECIDQARRFGYVETILKRRRPIPDIESRNQALRSFAERTAINSVVQGSAADLIKLAMVDLHNRLSEHPPRPRSAPPELPGVRMLLQIHDELVFEAQESAAQQAMHLIVTRMEAAMTLDVPLKAEASIGSDWFQTK